MSALEVAKDNASILSNPQNGNSLFKYLITIEPLGLLYGSAGRFLSPDNLVGRSGASFPPSSASLAGLFAAAYAQTEPDRERIRSLYISGPFWAKSDDPQNFYVPTPFNCLAQEEEESIKHQLSWNGKKWLDLGGEEITGKFDSGIWTGIEDWNDRDWGGKKVWMNKDGKRVPWKSIPHLHPQLQEDERRVKIEQQEDGTEKGSLFLENAVQLDSNYCLVYLSNDEIVPGWYRFGGEGHMVDVKCTSLHKSTQSLLTADLGKSFALITPAIWGSNRLSTRSPTAWEDKLTTWITERPQPSRYRLGGEGKTKRLSRGRYAVPAGTVYLTKESLPAWQNWDEAWFPREGISVKHLGCGLALPLPNALG